MRMLRSGDMAQLVIWDQENLSWIFRMCIKGWIWCVVPALGRRRQKDFKFEGNLGYKQKSD